MQFVVLESPAVNSVAEEKEKAEYKSNVVNWIQILLSLRWNWAPHIYTILKPEVLNKTNDSKDIHLRKDNQFGGLCKGSNEHDCFVFILK